MSKREAVTRYSLIIKKLRKHPAAFSEIANYLALESELQEYNFNISKRTFQRDLVDIKSIYNIDIQYDFSRKVYFIDYDQQPEVNERILEAFDIFNALNVSDRLSAFIHFENRKPNGTENLYGLLHAIKNSLQISFTYQKYWDDVITQRQVEPFALKEFKNRWYVLAKDRKDSQVKSFSLDRILELELSKIHFNRSDDFDVAKHYRYCFGIISPNSNQPREVVLSFNPLQGKYIKSLPLHETQEIMEDNENELRIRLKLFVTHDFLMEVLSHGESVRVIQPQSLIEELTNVYRKALTQYE